MQLGDALPPFEPDLRWLDDRAPSLAPGMPLVVHFWSAACPLCHEGAARIARWRSRFGAGLSIVAIMQLRPDVGSAYGAPPLSDDFARREAFGIVASGEPCAIDADRRLERRFENPYSPGYFIFDDRRRLRHRQMGNDRMHIMDSLLERLVVQASRADEA